MTIYTRDQYLNDSRTDGTAAHRRYFGQFVTPATIQTVIRSLGHDRLMASSDPHLNDIPLSWWDRMTPALPGSAGFKKAGDYYTLANGVCLAKEAARQYIEKQKAAQ